MKIRTKRFFEHALLLRHNSRSQTGGCELGPRPIDLHLKAFKELGITIDESHGFIACSVNEIQPTDIHLSFPSVGATENIMLAAATSPGITTITNAAKEPEIVDLQDYLNAMGAKISGVGTDAVTIEGVETLRDIEYTVIPDRIVAASYLAAAAATGSEIELTNVIIEHLNPVLAVLKEAGCKITPTASGLGITAPKRLKSVDYIRTSPQPEEQKNETTNEILLLNKKKAKITIALQNQ